MLLGQTDDLFCLPDTRLVDLPTYLDTHLHSLGFRAVAFHHPREGVRMTEWAGDPPVTPRSSPLATPPPLPGASGKALVAGPLGHMKVTNKPTSANLEPAGALGGDTGQQRFERMSDPELPGWIESFFQKDGPRAFVFKDFEYLVEFDQAASRHLWSVLRDVRRKNDGKKKVVFVSNCRDIDTLRTREERGPLLHSFEVELFQGNKARPNVFCIESPGVDEILNYQRRLRLRRCLPPDRPTSFTWLTQNCETQALKLRTAAERRLKNHTKTIRDHDWSTGVRTEGALIRLDALPGRHDVASRICGDVERARSLVDNTRDGGGVSRIVVPSVERLLDHSDAPAPPAVNLSYALVGRPGTGKTIIARLIGEALKEAGVLRNGHFIEASVQDLVGGYVGQTALKTNSLLARALGGVLFIDEVQGFEPDNEFHREAIRTLLKYIEDYRGDISVIVATYPNEFDRFLSIDPGLERRLHQRIDLDDYDPDTCVEILEHINAEKNVQEEATLDLAADLRKKFPGFFDAWIHDRTKKESEAFANAGSVRNLVEQMRRNIGTRDDTGTLLTEDDIPENRREYMQQAARRTGSVEERVKYAIESLEALPGLAEVKGAIGRIVNGIKAARLRGETGTINPGHYSFEGRPGTGKTTVARLLGKIFRELGVLKSGHVVEATRASLVGQYVGQTAPRVREQAERARDGVLFIDEAHNLLQGDRDSFGQEAIGELTAILENDRSRLCVILAGYTDQMERLFTADPGWGSRFSQRMQFSDFEPPEMLQIIRHMCTQRNRTLHSDLDAKLIPIFQQLRVLEAGGFSNGRSVRNLLGEMESNLDGRVVEADAGGVEMDPRQFTLDDVPVRLRA